MKELDPKLLKDFLSVTKPINSWVYRCDCLNYSFGPDQESFKGRFCWACGKPLKGEITNA